LSEKKVIQKSQRIWETNWVPAGAEKATKTVFQGSVDPHIKTHLPFVNTLLKSFPQNAVVLEAGCGNGQWVFYVEKLGFQCVGLDFAVHALKAAQRFAKKTEKIYLVSSDIQRLPFNDCALDCVLSFGVIEHFLDPSIILKDLFRVMKPSGKALITTPNIYCSHTFTRPISKLLGKWHLGYETSYSPRILGHLMEEAGFKINQEGVMIGGELFGTAPKYVPFVGAPLYNCLERLSRYIEKKTNMFGFWSFVIAEKPS
jgi:ubiquinone/menaquinone biosynthesis C-methylase UbiE